jgi:CBS domain-containing protein
MRCRCARDVMTREPITVERDAPAVDVARILERRHISGVPVVDEAGAVVGIVSEADLLVKALAEKDLRHSIDILTSRSWEERRRYEGQIAADLMTPNPVTATDDTPITELARIMLRRDINRIPILREGRLVGIVTRNDLLRVFERTDAEIYDDIERYLVDDLWIDPSRLRIQVENGVVTIQGEMDQEIEADLVKEGARLEGVAHVDASRLRYTVDKRGRRQRP